MPSAARSGDCELREDRAQALGGFAKRTFDLGFGCAGLVFLVVLILAVAAAILVIDGRPIFIRHRRVGRNGQQFCCLKFRTMVNDADALLDRALREDPELRQEWWTNRKLRRDPRITKLGAFLRRSSIDELPQLFNVLRGEMSIVGPRPIVVEEVVKYGNNIEYYYLARPGLTGSWQVSGRNDVSYQTRVQLDRKYVENWSLFADINIIGKTIPAVLGARGVY